MHYFVYILYTDPFDKYYIGQTSDIIHRLLLHNSGKVKSTSPFVPWRMIGYIQKKSRAEAMALEKKLKNLNRKRLLMFIEKYFE